MLVAETILSLQGHLRDYPVRYSQGRTQGSAFNSKPLKVQLLMASLLRTHKSPHFNSIYLFCAVQLFVGIVESKVLPFRFVSSLDRGNSHNILWKLHQFNSQSLKRKKKRFMGLCPIPSLHSSHPGYVGNFHPSSQEKDWSQIQPGENLSLRLDRYVEVGSAIHTP